MPNNHEGTKTRRSSEIKTSETSFVPSCLRGAKSVSSKRLNIAVVTGTRAEFGILRPVMEAIAATRSLRLQMIVTGMHLQRQFGYTLRDVQRSGLPIAAQVPMYAPHLTPAAALARGVAGLAQAFHTLRSDVVVVLGDRLEILAAATAALSEQKLIAHIHGGETAPGQWDEQIRHAVTKMAHLHFAATRAAGARIVQMGEAPARVHVVGAPALDAAAAAWRELSRTSSRAGFPLLVLHPTSPDDALEFGRASLVIQTIHRITGQRIVALGPNNDPGHAGILRAYRTHARLVDLQLSVPQAEFWKMLYGSRLLIGNSSAGIIEAATFACPVINIGPRQAGRQRSGNVLDVEFVARQIAAAIQTARCDGSFRRRIARRQNVYGDGHAAARIAAVLAKFAAQRLTPVKQFQDKR